MKCQVKNVLWYVCMLSLIGFAQERSDLKNPGERAEEGIKQAVLDYVEGIYQLKPERIERSVHPNLAKRGFYMDSGYQEIPMTYDELVELAGKYNKDGRVPADAPKEIEILDILDQTASVKLTAHWGIDYMHLAKYDGKWKILNVLWQSHPPNKSTSQSGAQVLKVGLGGGMQSTDHDISEIKLERTRCLGACPVYSVTIKSDGSFQYQGRENVEHIGNYNGKVSLWAYNQLAGFIKDSDYMNLENSYHSNMSDQATVKTSVRMKDGNKSVSNYGNAGPAKLWAIEQLIDKMIMEAEWNDSE